MEKYYYEGYDACAKTTGPTKPGCPYPSGSAEAVEWELGFSDGEFGWERNERPLRLPR